jgi:tRNA pseudouridine13 synthase
MKLKQYPTDFIVEEISSIIPSSDKDLHKIFLLEKEEMDTFEALRYLSKKWLVPFAAIGYAGLKDKHAYTKQLISIPTYYSVSPFRKNRIRTEFLGYSAEKIRIGELIGNRFTILVRDIKQEQLELVSKPFINIRKYGVFNYFDSQRFGSVIKQRFIVKAILQQDIESAMKWYLTLYKKSEARIVKDDKRNIDANWSDLSTLCIQDYRLRQLIDEYLLSSNWHAVYRMIPIHLRELFKNAYQSYLWNECIKYLAYQYIGENNLVHVLYAAGSLLFYSAISDEQKIKLPNKFPTISSTMELSQDEAMVLDNILIKEGIKLEDFDRVEETGTYFSTQYRKVFVKPQKFQYKKFEKDELNSKNQYQRFMVELSYELPKGSYATIITKSIFGH